MLFVVIERFRNGDPRPVYARLAGGGRGLPADVRYVGSWVTQDLKRCYQVMDCDTREGLDAWMAGWSDLVEFEAIPVVTSEAARQRALNLPAASGDSG